MDLVDPVTVGTGKLMKVVNTHRRKLSSVDYTDPPTDTTENFIFMNIKIFVNKSISLVVQIPHLRSHTTYISSPNSSNSAISLV